MTTADTDRSRWIALYVLCVGMLMIVLDGTVVNVRRRLVPRADDAVDVRRHAERRGPGLRPPPRAGLRGRLSPPLPPFPSERYVGGRFEGRAT
jgi:hypothetical protein